MDETEFPISANGDNESIIETLSSGKGKSNKNRPTTSTTSATSNAATEDTDWKQFRIDEL